MIQQDTTSALLSDSLRSDSLQTVDSLAGNDSVAHLDTVVKIIEKRFDGILHPSFPQNEAWVFILLLVLFGMLILKTPFSTFASILSFSTLSGKTMVCWNLL